MADGPQKSAKCRLSTCAFDKEGVKLKGRRERFEFYEISAACFVFLFHFSTDSACSSKANGYI